MFVIKRSGIKENVQFDKITSRLQKLLYGGLDKTIDPAIITQKICSRMSSGITTTELDNLASQICMGMIIDNPDFGTLGARIVISNHQKNTDDDFLSVVTDLKNNKDIQGNLAPLVSEELYNIVLNNTEFLQNMIDFERDYLLDYFGFKTLERSYLLKVNEGKVKRIVERPQHLFLRVAIGIHGDDFESVKKTYDNMSLKNYTHATPTLFNAGTNHPQLSSCFLAGTEDSVEGIFETMTDCAKISKWSGGIGLHISNIRANGSYIRKTAGTSDGIVPMLKVYNDIARYINQGGGKRNGSFAIYLEPHHADVIPFLEARKNVGPEELRARDLFYALWVSDYFMECIEKNYDWYLMDPDQSYGLNEVYGDEYTELYKKYVEEGKYMKKIKARELWEHIIASQIEHGMPYISYKDHVNRKSNQKHYGTIKSSNLCVSGDTMILTKNGYFPIKSLEKQNIEVWNGKEWSKTVAKKTGENQKLLKVKFTNGLELKCTEYHKFYIENGCRPADKSRPIIVEAKDLKRDMRIIRFETDVANDNDNHLKYAYTHGLYCADGTYSNKNIDKYRCSYKKQDNEIFCGRHLNHVQNYFTKDEQCCADCYSDKPVISLYKEKIKLLDYIDTIGVGKYIEKSDKICVSLPYDIEKKYYVPINNSIDSKIRWLEGYFDGDACIIENDGVKNIQFVSKNLNFIREIIYLLQTLGITAQIKTFREEGFNLLPDGKGGEKLYPTKKSYRSSVDSIGLNKLINMGFKPKRLDVSNSRLPHHKTNMYTKIEDVIDEDIYEDTYCFNEPLEHKGIFNGIITGQCNEINEYSDKDETAVCNLGSICLPKILEYPFTDEWRNLSDSKVSVYEDSSRLLKLYSTSDCDYCKLLKALLKSCGLSYIEIDEFEAETLRLKHNPESKPFETVPQLFSVKDEDIVYLGGYSDNWKLLSPKINYNKLYELAYELTVNLNKVIDINFYPTEKTRISNMKHRPIGLGVQGLADVFMTLKLPFTSDEAREINKEIFETIYFGSMSASVYLAKRDGRYPTYEGSPLSEGKFQYNLWGLKDVDLSGRWKWGELRNDLLKYGSRNSLNIALMPTASTASIFGNVESFEAITSNLYTRNVLSGVFTMINKYLIKDLIDLEIWNQDTKDRLIYNKGSVQNLRALPKFLRDVYKTSFEIDQKQIIKMSAERGVFVCQSQSLNLFFDKPTFKELTACHFYGWKNGLKTGSYYIRTRSAISGQNFGLDPRKEKQLREEKINDVEDEGCLSCGA
jgi:ribonucleoside-diphosphate reductase alpha chain